MPKKSYKNQELIGEDFSNQDLQGADFSDAVLVGANFSGSVLCGANFSGANFSEVEVNNSGELTGANFSNANIRGTNFSDTILIGATFNGAKAGLQSHWGAGLTCCSVMAAALSGLITAYASMFIAIFIFSAENYGMAGTFFSIFTLFLLFYFPFNAGRSSKRLELSLVALAFSTIAIVVVAALPKSLSLIAALAVFQLFSLAGSVAGVTLWSLALATVISVLGKLAAVIAVVIGAFPGVILGALLGLQGTAENLKPIALGIDLALSLLLFFSSFHIGNQILSGNEKYALLRTMVLFLSTRGGTSFKGANLTDSNFTRASLKHTDLTRANLTRTFWRHAKALNYALVTGSYLDSPKIQKLVVEGKTEDGNKNFEHQNLQGLNLQSGNLQEISFMGSNLSKANLRNADLLNANLKQTQLYGAYLTAARLTGACIEDWGISPETLLEEIKCDYVFMRQTTKDKNDPWRKPDNWGDIFQEGDFSDFIAPIITTLDAYNPRKRDLSELDRTFKPLDFYHYGGIDPKAVVIAIKQLQEEYPEANLEIVALYGPGKNKIRIEAKVSDEADASNLNAEYQAKYQQNKLSPSSSLQSLLAKIEEKDDQIKWLRETITNVRGDRYYIERVHGFESKMSEIKVDSGGGSVSGIVGDIRDVKGVVNLGEIQGAVTNSIGGLPESPIDKPGLKELLTKLKEAIDSETDLSPEDKVEALEQVKILAEAGKKPDDGVLRKTAKTAVKVLKGTVASLPDAAKLAEACGKLLPIIISLLALS